MSSLRDQISNLAAQGSCQRLDAYGHDCIYEGFSFQATKTPARNLKKLRDGGFTLEADLSIRFSKSAIPIIPTPESAVTVAGVLYRVSEVKDITDPHPEWLLALHALS